MGAVVLRHNKRRAFTRTMKSIMMIIFVRNALYDVYTRDELF
jgi:hypothetical protein